MDKEDWLRTMMLSVAPQENKRMQNNCGMQINRDQWALRQKSKKAGALGGRPTIKGSTK